MVARLLHRLLQSYEQHTGEDFEGEQASAAGCGLLAVQLVRQGLGTGMPSCIYPMFIPCTLLGLATNSPSPTPAPFLPLPQHQFDQLYELAKAALGSSLTKRTLKSLVRSYLGI